MYSQTSYVAPPPTAPVSQTMPPAQPVQYVAGAPPPVVAGAPAPVVVVQQSTTAPLPANLGPSSMMCVCPSCHSTITTTTVYETGTLCWVICLIMLLFGLWLGCCLIPFCVDGCKDVVHKCPNCNALIGRYKRL